MLCREVMKRDVASCREDDTALRCAELMRSRDVGFLPVVDMRGVPVGIVTDRDLVVRVMAPERPPSLPVREFMTREVVFCEPGDDLKLAEDKMARMKRSRLVVADAKGHCVGVISLSDIAQADTQGRAGEVLQAVTRRGPALPRRH